MGILVGKVAVVALLIYVSLVLADVTCPVGLTSCQLFEPFSPW